MTTSETFQIPTEAAELYEAAFVPNFFAQWAPALCSDAGVGPGDRVLDVACGTGVVARTAAPLVEPGGTVTGVDLNEAMLAVARRVAPAIEWRTGDVADLPFPDGSYDRVLSQMALMFFADRRAAVAEMARVARRGGTVAVDVPSPLAAQPAFATFVDLAGRHAGPDAVSLLSTYFSCGDPEQLGGLAEAAGLEVVEATVRTGTYSAPSVDAAVTTEVESTPLVERISDAQYGRIREGAHEVFAEWVGPDGRLVAPFATTFLTARRR